MNLIQENEENLSSSNSLEQQIKAAYEKLNFSNQKGTNVYEKLNTLSLIKDEQIRVNSKQQIKISKFADKEKNIAFLMKVYKDNMDMMEIRI